MDAESLAVARLDSRSVVDDGLARQHLHDDALAADVVQVAGDLVGLHATGAPNPYLQLLVRMIGFERSMLDRGCTSGALRSALAAVLQTWSIR